jgi:hypothetical protein
MDIQVLVARIAETWRKRREPVRKAIELPVRGSLADIPLRQAQKPVYRPKPPIRPASNM